MSKLTSTPSAFAASASARSASVWPAVQGWVRWWAMWIRAPDRRPTSIASASPPPWNARSRLAVRSSITWMLPASRVAFASSMSSAVSHQALG